MRTLFLIIKHEITTTMGKPSFWVMTILFPALLIGMNLMSRMAVDEQVEAPAASPTVEESIGLVDETGLIKAIPPSLPGELLVRYASAADGAAALRDGSISQLVVIPASYPEDGRLTVTMRAFNPLSSTPDGLIQYLMAYNLTGDEASANLLTHPSAALKENAQTPQTSEDFMAGSLPYTVLTVFFFFFTFSSSLMLNSVSREKMNRTAEVLLLCLEPRTLMLGKILGLSVVALFQMLIWAVGFLWVTGGQGLLQAGTLLQLPAGLLAWALVYFILGYLMYASLMGAAGALSPSLREAGQVTFFIIMPIMLPVLLSSAFSEDPNGVLPLILSLFPFTAPTAMLTRMVLTPVPVWQSLLGLALLAVTTGLIVQMAARAFRADTLLSNAPISLPRMLAEMRAPAKGN